MTISSSYAPDNYVGDGVNDTFAITFAFLDVSTNVKVSIKDTDGDITVKTAGVEYNVSGSNVVFTGGNIPIGTDTVILELNPDFKQETDYTENGNFPAETHETALDKLTLEVQINNDLITRSIKVDATEDLTITDWTLPNTVADSALVINATGDGLDVVPFAAIPAVTLPVPIELGGTASASASTARTALGLAIGSDVQGFNSNLLTLSTAFTTASASGPASLDFAEDTDNGSNAVTLIGAASTADVTLTLPAATDTLVGKATTDTLTNKTLTSPIISTISNTGTLTLPTSTDTLMGRATTDTMTNKTFDASGTGNSISNVDLTADVIGTLPVGNGGTGATSLTADALLTGNTASAIQAESNITAPGGILTVGNGSTSAGQVNFLEDSDNGTNRVSLIGPASTADVTLTLPAATDTLMGKATTDTLTNKTFDANASGNSLSNVDVADLANGTDGELITWDSSGVAATVAVGTATEVLTSNGAGAAPTFQAAGGGGGGGGLVFLSSVTASASASLEFTADIDGTFDVYLFEIVSFRPASNNTQLRFRTSTDGGSTFDSGSGNYDYALSGHASNNVDGSIGSSSSTFIGLNETGGGLGSGAGKSLNGTLRLHNPTDTAIFTHITAMTSFDKDGGDIGVCNIAGTRNATADVDAVQFIMSSGNITSGTIRMYGIASS